MRINLDVETRTVTNPVTGERRPEFLVYDPRTDYLARFDTRAEAEAYAAAHSRRPL